MPSAGTGGFAERFTGVEDYHYWLRVALGGGCFAFCSSTTAVYHFHAANLTHSVSHAELLHTMFCELAARTPRTCRAFCDRVLTLGAKVAERRRRNSLRARAAFKARIEMQRILGGFK